LHFKKSTYECENVNNLLSSPYNETIRFTYSTSFFWNFFEEKFCSLESSRRGRETSNSRRQKIGKAFQFHIL